jgi:hypothetical protein
LHRAPLLGYPGFDVGEEQPVSEQSERVSPEAAYAAALLEGVDLDDLDAVAAAFGEDLSLWDRGPGDRQ